MKKPPTDGGELVHLRASRAGTYTTTEPPERGPTLRPRVAIDSRSPLLQMTHEGVEWVVDRIEHGDDGGRLSVTLSGPLRALEHGDRVEQGARMAAEVSRRIRT